MEPFTVACCQLRAHDIEDAEANLAQMLAALDEAGEGGAQLVLLPECSYPAYYLRDRAPYARENVRPYAEVTGLLGQKCREYGFWLAAGLAAPHAAGGVTNSGVVFDPDGEIVGQYDKTFLWHFDNDWFEPGDGFPVFDTGFCKFGILICADGRPPEIARSLAVNGAELIVDLTAWVASGPTVADLKNSQCEYLMPVRALENGVWVAAADKWGSEDGTILYTGSSCVIDPSGTTVARASTDETTVLFHEITPQMTEVLPRRPSLYRRIVAPYEDLPIAKVLREPIVPADEDRRVAVVPGGNGFEPTEVAATFDALRRQDADLVVFAGMSAFEGWEGQLPVFESAVRDRGGMMAFAVDTQGCAPMRTGVLVTPERTYEHRATHGRGVDTGEINAPVVPTPIGNVALLCGEEGMAPEVARCLALEGADILAWSAFEHFPLIEKVARARSDANHVYTAAAWPGGAAIMSPSGAPIIEAPAGVNVAMAAQVNKAVARWKDMAPGTNVIRDRQPELYGSLVRG
jgi:predicted amidohydrolase